MTIITGRQFRANQSKYIEMANKGERVILSSKSGYAELNPVSESDKDIKEFHNSRCLMAIARKARKEHEEGKTLKFNSAIDAQKWMDSL